MRYFFVHFHVTQVEYRESLEDAEGFPALMDLSEDRAPSAGVAKTLRKRFG